MTNEIARQSNNSPAVRNAGGSRTRPNDLGNIVLENSRIVFRNFSGKEGQYNREGDRNFALLLDKDIAEQMLADGWNVKFLRPREEGDEPQAYVQVAVSYKNRPPRIVMITSRGRTDIPEELVSVLDWAEIANVDLILNPYPWAVSGKSGIKAYLKTLFITIAEDELELKYADVPDSAQNSLPVAEQLSLEAASEDQIWDAEIIE
jgi:hypothetical protein